LIFSASSKRTRSSAPVTGTPSTASKISPVRRPAWSAGLSASTAYHGARGLREAEAQRDPARHGNRARTDPEIGAALKASGVAITCEVLTFASREDPTLVCQEMSLIPSNDCDVQVKAMLDGAGIAGRALRHIRDTPGESKPACDGTLLWESPGGLGVVGFAYVTGMRGGGAREAKPKCPPLANNRLETTYSFGAQAGQRYQLQQVTSVVCGVMHHQPDHHAARMVAKARSDGFDTLRAENRAAWVELWKGRIRLIGADERWLADAAFFYLHSSVHSSSPASTSIFGLATWHDYHCYYGHVMWDRLAPVMRIAAAIMLSGLRSESEILKEPNA
jgi:trehalose/maltose hydrolase-like predicted phosphorylase